MIVLACVQFAERKGRDLPGSVQKVGFTIYRRVSELNSLTYLQRDRNLQALDLCTYPVVSLSLVTEPPLAPCLALPCCPRSLQRPGRQGQTRPARVP